MDILEFHLVAPGASAAAAFEAARAAARAQHGDGGATGTIADLCNVVLAHGAPLTKEAALAKAAELGTPEAGSCHALELIAEPGRMREFLLFGSAAR